MNVDYQGGEEMEREEGGERRGGEGRGGEGIGLYIMCFQTVFMCGTVIHCIALMLSHGPQFILHFTECEGSALLMPHL